MKPIDIIPDIKVLYNESTSNDISFLDLDERSRSHDKVKGHRRGGVCVL